MLIHDTFNISEFTAIMIWNNKAVHFNLQSLLTLCRSVAHVIIAVLVSFHNIRRMFVGLPILPFNDDAAIATAPTFAKLVFIAFIRPVLYGGSCSGDGDDRPGG